ncbi:hypothetical protein MWU77_19345 [Rhodococcus sp. F64268]|uniref:hypothetical protein n=1 Tax=Rhodococcus sp. F64268 TaxID=2926402 RepID=UPI001FF5AE2A|nr:hypothetical protein [Rhodococcus sp. F64268]MCK0092935.1 hypothetical protein [Rhodococcus sp. F64268]
MSEQPGVLGRIRRLLARRVPERLDITRSDLAVVVESFDDSEACSTALDRGAQDAPHWAESDDAVLRHHLELPAEAVEEALALAGQDGYVAAAPPSPVSSERPSEDGVTRVSLILQRVQLLDAMHCAQEKSRMASLAQRLGGDARGWDALQPE